MANLQPINTGDSQIASKIDNNFKALNNADSTGNAATATKLQTAREIGGVSFDGTTDIDLAGVNIIGNQDSTGNAATASKLKTARTLAITGDATGSASFDGSGDLSINTVVKHVDGTVAAGSTFAPVSGGMAGNDNFKIVVGGTDNAGSFEIMTGDDGNEPIAVSQWTGASQTRKAYLLDGSGNTSFPNTIQSGVDIVANRDVKSSDGWMYAKRYTGVNDGMAEFHGRATEGTQISVNNQKYNFSAGFGTVFQLSRAGNIVQCFIDMTMTSDLPAAYQVMNEKMDSGWVPVMGTVIIRLYSPNQGSSDVGIWYFDPDGTSRYEGQYSLKAGQYIKGYAMWVCRNQ